jgi:hypothetical protein
MSDEDCRDAIHEKFINVMLFGPIHDEAVEFAGPTAIYLDSSLLLGALWGSSVRSEARTSS